MRIVCLTTFKDGARTFAENDVCTVADEDGQRFVDNGWATVEGTTATVGTIASPVDLAVHNAVLGVADKKGA
jgi:hypothetical protein